MYYVYVLKSVNFKRSYIGYTNDIKRRLFEHNSGKNLYTRRYKPWKLIYAEEFEDERGALSREKYFKSAGGRKFLKKVIFKE